MPRVTVLEVIAEPGNKRLLSTECRGSQYSKWSQSLAIKDCSLRNAMGHSTQSDRRAEPGDKKLKAGLLTKCHCHATSSCCGACDKRTEATVPPCKTHVGEVLQVVVVLRGEGAEPGAGLPTKYHWWGTASHRRAVWWRSGTESQTPYKIPLVRYWKPS